MNKHAAKTPAKPRLRKVGQTAKIETPKPLDHGERSVLFDLIDDAHGSNHRLLTCARDLQEAQDAFAIAKQNLEIAEADLRQERAENQRIHTEMAPLFHRLPA